MAHWVNIFFYATRRLYCAELAITVDEYRRSVCLAGRHAANSSNVCFLLVRARPYSNYARVLSGSLSASANYNVVAAGGYRESRAISEGNISIPGLFIFQSAGTNGSVVEAVSVGPKCVEADPRIGVPVTEGKGVCAICRVVAAERISPECELPCGRVAISRTISLQCAGADCRVEVSRF